MKLTINQLAKQVSQLNWMVIQSDEPNENEKLLNLKSELVKLPVEQAVNLLLNVLEAKELNNRLPNYKLFKEMLDFEHVK